MPADYADFTSSRQKALQQYDAAFHLLNVTFPLVKDSKLLMGVASNVMQSLEHCMDSVLAYDRQFNLIPEFQNNFQSKFNLFRYRSAKRYNIPIELLIFMMDLHELLELHKKCPTEFQRGNRYILASKDFRMKVLSINDFRRYLDKNKEFIQVVDRILKVKG
ncbi:MAG: hypothetical protein AB1668_05000 [Nanoarchaeota archaeon]